MTLVCFDDDLAIGSFSFDVFRKDRIIRRHWASLPATTTKSYVKFNNREGLWYLWTFDGELLDILSSTSDSEINEKLRRVTNAASADSPNDGSVQARRKPKRIDPRRNPRNQRPAPERARPRMVFLLDTYSEC
jgi:hypothetical protein